MPIFVGVLAVTSTGGLTYIVSHMLHESRDSEVSTAAAFSFLYGLGAIIIDSFFGLTSSMLSLVLVGVLVALTFFLWF